MFKKIDDIMNKKSVKFVLILAFIISYAILYSIMDFLINNPIFEIKYFDIPMWFVLFALISSICVYFLEKIILLINIKPTITNKEYEKLINKYLKNIKKIKNKKIDKKVKNAIKKENKKIGEKFKENELVFENWLGYFIFTMTFMIWMNARYAISESFSSIMPQIKRLFSKKKNSQSFFIIKILCEDGVMSYAQSHPRK